MRNARKLALNGGYRYDGEEPVLNLTSLIDVVFVVLIMFIVIAPLLDVDKVLLANGSPAPKVAQGSLLQSVPMVIAVDADDRISFNKRPLTLEQLQIVLRHLHQKFPKNYPQLFHDRNATFGTYQSVKQAVEMAGFKELDVILMPGA